MTDGQPSEQQPQPSRQRSVYIPWDQYPAIMKRVAEFDRKREKKAGRKLRDRGLSSFLIKCALHDDDGAASGHPLVLEPDEQRKLSRQMTRLDHCSKVLLGEGSPRLGISLLEALELLVMTRQEELSVAWQDIRKRLGL